MTQETFGGTAFHASLKGAEFPTVGDSPAPGQRYSGECPWLLRTAQGTSSVVEGPEVTAAENVDVKVCAGLENSSDNKAKR